MHRIYPSSTIFPVIVLALDLSTAVLVHEVDNHALGSVVCHIRHIGDVSD